MPIRWNFFWTLSSQRLNITRFPKFTFVHCVITFFAASTNEFVIEIIDTSCAYPCTFFIHKKRHSKPTTVLFKIHSHYIGTYTYILMFCLYTKWFIRVPRLLLYLCWILKRVPHFYRDCLCIYERLYNLMRTHHYTALLGPTNSQQHSFHSFKF